MRLRSPVLALSLLVAALFAPGVRAELFVANCDNDSISVYSEIAFGDRNPLRTIAGALTTLDCPRDVAVDMQHQEILVTSSSQDSITVFALHAGGDVAPLRKIQGLATALSDPEGVDVDPVHDEIFVADDNASAVLVFARTANGNSAPLRQIVGALTGLISLYGVDYVPPTDELVVAASTVGSRAIFTFDRTDTGNVAPKRAIKGAATSLDDVLRGVVVDAENEEIFTAIRGDFPASDRVLVFPRVGDGNVAPSRTIQLLGTTLVINGLALTPRGELLAAISEDQVQSVLKSSSGEASAQRGLSGASTGLDNPFGLATNDGLEAPLPDGPFLTSDELDDFRVKVRITQIDSDQIAGTKVDECINNTLCVAGAIPSQSEIYVRVVGPKPNGFLWPTLVKFNTSRTEVWVQQISTGVTRYYLLENSTQDNDVLPGLFHRTGFLP